MNNSQLEMVTLQSLDYQAVNFSNRKSFVEQDANMSWSIGLFGSQLSRYKIDSIMQGQGASVGDVEIIFGIDNQSFDISSNLIHSAPNTKGRVLVKSVMKDTSQSLFKGMIKINKNAKSTESYLAGHVEKLDGRLILLMDSLLTNSNQRYEESVSKPEKTIDLNTFKLDFDLSISKNAGSIGWVALSIVRNDLCLKHELTEKQFYYYTKELIDQFKNNYELSSGGEEGIIIRGLLHGFVRCL